MYIYKFTCVCVLQTEISVYFHHAPASEFAPVPHCFVEQYSNDRDWHRKDWRVCRIYETPPWCALEMLLGGDSRSSFGFAILKRGERVHSSSENFFYFRYLIISFSANWRVLLWNKSVERKGNDFYVHSFSLYFVKNWGIIFQKPLQSVLKCYIKK